MRISLLFVFGITSLLGRDVIPGIVSFDEPLDLRGFGPHHDPGDSSFVPSRTVIQYQPRDNSPRSFRQFDIGISVVGYDVGEGKRIIFRSLSDEELKQELSRWAGEGVAVSVADAVISDHKAFRLSWQRTAPALRPGASLYTETYFVPFEPNRGVTLRLTADSSDGIAGLRALLTRVAIPKDPHEIAPPPPPAPTAEKKKKEQIVSNLRVITSAADQFLLEHGVTRVAMSELKQQKNLWVSDQLMNITSVDGEVYDDLVFEQGKGLRVTTRTLGQVTFAP